MRPRLLFVASCISLVTSAFTFIVRGDILQDMGNSFKLSQAEKGALEGAVFLGMAFSMLVGGFICDLLGMRRIMRLAFFCHLIGVLGTIFAPHSDISFQWLFFASFLMGCGNGMVETGINPLAATLYPLQKTHYLNILHAWWPGGLVIGGLFGRLVGKGIDLGFLYVPGLELHWQWSLVLILIPCLVYGVMLLGQPFPLTERVESGVSYGDMFKEAVRPAFLLWAFCMLLTAATELGPQKWQESVMTRTAGVSGTMILVYTSGLMFVMRHFAGPLAHAVSPVGMLTVSALLSGVGLFLLSHATTGLTAFAFATIFGLGIAYFWPTMLGVTAERFPKGGALLLCLMGSVGNLSISQVLPQMGKVYDNYAVSKLKEDDPELAEKVVRDGTVNQDLAKHLSVLAKLSPEERKAIDPKSWLTAKQQETVKSWPDAVAKDPYQWDLDKLNLSLEQEMIVTGLLDKSGEQLKRRQEMMKVWQENDLADQQKVFFTDLKNVTSKIEGWQLLREVQAAQLTEEQRHQLAKSLEEKGETGAQEKILKDDFDPDSLTTKEQQVVRESIKELSLTKPQEEIIAKKKAVSEAEALGAAMAFRWVVILPAILIFIFAAIALNDRSRGGYKAVHLGSGEGGKAAH